MAAAEEPAPKETPAEPTARKAFDLDDGPLEEAPPVEPAPKNRGLEQTEAEEPSEEELLAAGLAEAEAAENAGALDRDTVLVGDDSPTVSHFTLAPESRFRLIWNYIALLGISWYAISAPIFLALEIDFLAWYYVVDVAWTTFFMVDIYINFKSPFVRDGALVTDPRAIRRNYLKSWFALDFLATFPFDLVILGLTSHTPMVATLARLARIFKVVRLFRITDVVVNLSSHGRQALITSVAMDASHHIKIALIFFWSLAGLNGVACLWIYVHGMAGTGEPVSIYIQALYWTITTMTTVGYGDIIPTTDLERLFAIFVELLGVLVYGLVIGNISSLMTKARAHKLERRDKVASLALFMKRYRIPRHLQSEIFNFYNHFLKEQTGQSSKILKELPAELQKEINLYIRASMLRHVPFIEEASSAFVANLVGRLKSRIVAPMEPVYRHGDPGWEMFFISYGAVEVLDGEGRPQVKLRGGSFFGETALLQDAPRSTTVVSVTFTELFVLTRADFDAVTASHPDFKRFLVALSWRRRMD